MDLADLKLIQALMYVIITFKYETDPFLSAKVIITDTEHSLRLYNVNTCICILYVYGLANFSRASLFTYKDNKRQRQTKQAYNCLMRRNFGIQHEKGENIRISLINLQSIVITPLPSRLPIFVQQLCDTRSTLHGK